MQANNREGSGQSWVTQGQIFDFFLFRIRNVSFWTILISGFKKCHFYFCAVSKNAQNLNLKNDVVHRYGFWAICLPKIDISPRNLACQMSRHSFTSYCIFFYSFEIFGLWKRVIYKFQFYYFWVKESFFGESGMTVLKHFLFYFICVFYFHFP